MTDILTTLRDVIPTLHGWATIEKASTLALYALALRPEVCCEIGTWGGRSALPMLLACKQLNHGQVHCIDPWSQEESAKGQTSEADLQWWKEVANHDVVYQSFLEVLNRFEVRHFCNIQRTSSDAATVPDAIDLLHVDGNHGPQAYTDTVKFASHVRLNGVCVLDDLEWSGGHVLRAQSWLLENGFIKLHALGTGATYLRVK